MYLTDPAVLLIGKRPGRRTGGRGVRQHSSRGIVVVDVAVPAGIRTFELPPDGFDPLQADPAALRRTGLPRRPDPEREPQLARAYQRAFSRPWSYTQPELVTDPTIDALRAAQRARGGFTSGDWGGGGVDGPADTTP